MSTPDSHSPVIPANTHVIPAQADIQKGTRSSNVPSLRWERLGWELKKPDPFAPVHALSLLAERLESLLQAHQWQCGYKRPETNCKVEYDEPTRRQFVKA